MNYSVTEEDNGLRLDELGEVLFQGSYTRSALKKLIKTGNVQVNGQIINKPSHTVHTMDKVSIYLPEKIGHKIHLEVIYEDSDCIVVNKPAGLLVHQRGNFDHETTLGDYIESRFGKIEGQGLVHRLDRATSGVMIVAKNEESRAYLQAQFADREVSKYYVAITNGEPQEKKFIIDMPIARHPKKQHLFQARLEGKPATTEVQMIKRIPETTWSALLLKPITGRTHQLRVHLAQLNHAIAGDTFYDGPTANRLMLHAFCLSITLLKDGQRHTFIAPIPDDMKQYLEDDEIVKRLPF